MMDENNKEPEGADVAATAIRPYKGSCLCGAVEVEATPPKLFSVICHCTICQRLGSASGQALVGFPGKSLRLVSTPNAAAAAEQQQLLDSYQTSEGMIRYRCKACGSSVYNQSLSPDLDFRDAPLANFERDPDTGIIERLEELTPTTHIFCQHRTPGLVGTDAAGVTKWLGHVGHSKKVEEVEH